MRNNYKINANCVTAYLGKHYRPEDALKKLNKFFTNGWYESCFLEGTETVLIENSSKEIPFNIIGNGKDRIASLHK